MTDERHRAKSLDDALAGRSKDGDDPLVGTADAVKRSLAVDVPPADRTRALFVSAVSAREKPRFPVGRLLVPALGLAVVLYAVMAGRSAAPGERLYPLRKALNVVGVSEDPVAEADDHLHTASGILHEAELALNTNPGKSLRLAVSTLEYLGRVRALLPELGNQRRSALATIESLEDRAVKVISLATDPEEIDDNSGPGSSEAGDEDSSGPGSGDDSDDSSGPGSGSDDNSGPGSGDESDGSEDSSGSGSGDASTDDSSGSGSSGSGSDSDNSGSGSDDGSGDSGSSESDDED